MSCCCVVIYLIFCFFFCLFVPLLCFADLDTPVLTVHQTISDVRGSYYQEKTVFLRCTVNSNPPARFIWKRGSMLIEQSKDTGVDIYEPLYTQVPRTHGHMHCSVPLPGMQRLAAFLILSLWCLTESSPLNFILRFFLFVLKKVCTLNLPVSCYLTTMSV